MVAEQELAIVIDDRAARGGAAQIGITVRVVVHGLIDAGQVGVHSGQHVIGAAEGTHKALLFFWVALLHSQLLIAGSTGDHRPTRQIVPVGVCTQKGVCGDQRCVYGLVDELTVAAAGGPVHEPDRLKGGRVGHADAHMSGHTARAWLVFVRGHSPVSRDDNAQTRALRRVLAGAVNAVAEAQLVHFADDGFRLPAGNIIKVKRDDVAPGHVVCLAALPQQGATHKAANILQVVLLRLLQMQIVLQGFSSTDRGRQPFIEFFDGQHRLFPDHITAVVAYGYGDLSVIVHNQVLLSSGSPPRHRGRCRLLV